MVVLTKDNVMQARYTNPEQDTISILFIDHDAEGKARANYEIFCEAGDQQHKELHAAGWDHATIEKETVEWIKDSHRQAGEALLGHEATKIIDERLRVTKEALAKAVEAFKETRKLNDAIKEKIEENTARLKESNKEYSLLEILAQCTPEGGAGPDNPIKDMGHDDLLKKELRWKTLDWE